jgi:hypothetical protein
MLTGVPAGRVLALLLTKVNVVSAAPCVTRMSTFFDVEAAFADDASNAAEKNAISFVMMIESLLM